MQIRKDLTSSCNSHKAPHTKETCTRRCTSCTPTSCTICTSKVPCTLAQGAHACTCTCTCTCTDNCLHPAIRRCHGAYLSLLLRQLRCIFEPLGLLRLHIGCLLLPIRLLMIALSHIARQSAFCGLSDPSLFCKFVLLAAGHSELTWTAVCHQQDMCFVQSAAQLCTLS